MPLYVLYEIVYTEFLFSKLFVIFYLLIFYRSPITLAESV